MSWFHESHRLLTPLVAALVIASAGVASAQSDEGTAAAKAAAYYQEGLAEIERNNYEVAAELFVKAWRLDPDPSLAFNAARAYENNGDLEQARTYYQTALDSNPSEEVRKRCEASLIRLDRAEARLKEQLEAAKPTTAAVSIAANDVGEVFIDGQPKGETPLSVTLEPGEHTVVVRRSGFREFSQVVQAEAGEQVAIFAELEEVPLISWVGWGGLGMVALGSGLAATGLIYEGQARDAYDEAQQLEAQRDRARFDQLRDDGEGDTFTARVLYGSGITVAIVGAGLFVADLLIDPEQEQPPPSEPAPGEAQLWLTPDGQAGVLWTW